MKIKILIIITTISCFLIYKIASNEPKTYVALGDSSCIAASLSNAKMTSYNNLLYDYLYKKRIVNNYNDDYCYVNLNINELIENINNNSIKNSNHILSVFDQAKYITLMIGFDELTSYKKVDNIIKKDFIESYKTLVKLIKENTKANIIVIGFYPGFFNDSNTVNSQIMEVCRNNDITFIDPSNIRQNNNYLISDSNYRLNRNGSNYLFNLIREKI